MGAGVLDAFRNMFRFELADVSVVPGVHGGLDWPHPGVEARSVRVAGSADSFTVWKNVVSATSLNAPSRVPVRLLVVPQSSVVFWMGPSFFSVRVIAPCLPIPVPVSMDALVSFADASNAPAGNENEYEWVWVG